MVAILLKHHAALIQVENPVIISPFADLFIFATEDTMMSEKRHLFLFLM